MKDVLLYWASDWGRMRLGYAQSKDIKSTLDSISEKYFSHKESRGCKDINDSSLKKLLQPAEGEENLLRSLKQRLSEMDSDDQSLLGIKQTFLEHGEQKT